MKYFLFTVFLIGACTQVFGQDFDHYQTLLPKAPVPADFIQRSSDKFAADAATLTNEKGRIKKEKKKFYLQSNFNIDYFLSSGKVLFNDEITLYVGRVLAEVLKPYPDLQKKVRVYTVKSPVVNAFTTNNGIIFVNLGLLARLQNESQLAFILAHEVTHFQKKHVINSFVTEVEIDKAKGDYRKLSEEERMYAKSTYSKEYESEADIGAAALYLQSSYSRDSIYKVFDILKYADIPLSWVPFNKSVFESGDYIFPERFLLNEITADIRDENYDDSRSTHPNIKKRKETVVTKFKQEQAGKGVQYKVSRSLFELTRKTAQYELCREFLLEQQYAKAIALALSLKQDNQDSPYLQQTIGKALYGLAKRKLQSISDIQHRDWYGESQRLAFFLQQLSTHELCVLAIRELNKCYEATPANEEITLMLNDIMYSFASHDTGLEKKFLRKAGAPSIGELEYPYTQYAFVGSKDLPSFFKRFDYQNDLANKEPDTGKTRKDKEGKSRISPMKSDNIVIVNPLYKKYDTRKREKVRYADAEDILIEINDKIREAAANLDLNAQVLNPNKVSTSSIEVMKNSSIMNDWIGFKLEMDDDNMVSPIHNEIVALANTYKSDHFVWIGGASITRGKQGKAMMITLGIIFPPALPVFIWHMATPRRYTLYFALVFNVRTERLELIDFRQMKMNDTSSMMKSNIYYTLFKLKNRKP